MLNERLQRLRDKVAARGYGEYRTGEAVSVAEEFARSGISYPKRSALRLRAMLEAEKPVILPDEHIVLFRTGGRVPSLFTAQEWEKLTRDYFIFDSAKICNISSDYATTLSMGLLARRNECEDSMRVHAGNPEALEFLEAAVLSIDAVLDFSERIRRLAEKEKRYDIARVFANIPAKGAETFYEACQFFRLLNFILWINGNHHNTLGRFDQYMLPFYLRDIQSGRMTKEEAFDILVELFLSLNKDTDLYPGVQQGDNGQSLVLGGCCPDGSDGVNELTELCLRSSLEIGLIDPKINLRTSKETPLWLYELGTRLTAKGLGFPQYENDDVVIPGLCRLGYEAEDARDYIVAACWEFIIPGKGMDIPNIDCLNFPKIVNRALFSHLEACDGFEDLMEAVRNELRHEIDTMLPRFEPIFAEPSPFQSVLMDGCVASGRDISKGAKYNNFGIHGAGISTAADSLAAVQTMVFEKKRVEKGELLNALKADFEGYDDLRALLLNETPKMGNNDDRVDDLAVRLLDWFADSLEGRRNERGGVYRAGTGTAMYYLWSAAEVGATADGRLAAEPFAANFSPSLNVRLRGPLSVIKSFSKPHLERTINGGPLTIELHDTVFRNEQGIQKTALLVKSYMDLGGHQLQLNAISRDTLLDAQDHPEKYPNLIVRVWGWSGYFIELDRQYQDHIISRVAFQT